MSEWFLLVVEEVFVGDPLSTPMGQRIPKRQNVRVLGPLASEEAARQAGADLLSGAAKQVVMFQGVQLGAR